MQDLLHSLSPSSFSDLSVLDRQRARFQWRQSFESMDESNDLSCDSLLSVPIELHDLQMDQHPLNELAEGTPNLARCFASPLKNKKESASKKRKAGKSHKMDYCDGEEEKQKRARTGNSPENSKETGAPPPPPKQDFIHVRARRGQATDSHSLAERVRRERISERMKYLQGLVPGCNKITGKAGMLDEIINYVQSLQKQVEFLSMKLATANPWIDFNIDTFFPKEVSFACNPSNNLAPAGLSPDVVEPYLQMNPMHQMAACCGLNMNLNVSELELALRRSLGSTASLPDAFFDASFDVDNSSWDANSESISGVDIHQGKGVMLALQSFTGNGPQNNLKMEM